MTSVPRIIPKDNSLMQTIDSHWRRLHLTLASLNVRYLDSFWSAVKQLGDYNELADFALSVLSLPHGNADCERVFSTVNCMKKKLRNRLNTETINGALHTKQLIKGGRDSGKHYANFQHNDEMFSRMTKTFCMRSQMITKVPLMYRDLKSRKKTDE